MDNVEQQLLSIWQAIIHSEAINPQENLLDQGGNSLHFIKLASMVSKTFNLKCHHSIAASQKRAV